MEKPTKTTIPKKRGPKKTKVKEDVPKPPPKKRGRKPKGGKIVKNEEINKNVKLDKQNTILHLKCKLSDLNIQKFNSVIDYDPSICNVEPWSEKNNYEIINNTKTEDNLNKAVDIEIVKNTDIKDNEKKAIINKLLDLEKLFNYNDIKKKSNCFWCTCAFDSPPIYIPSLYFKNKYDVYGCFCSPECACSYLFNENIDDSTKFERYHLLNYIYGKVYNHEKNIKQAPNPFYTLDKYYGNLSIQQYRALLEYDRLILVINKPLTKIFPEIHEDTPNYETVYDSKINLKKKIKVEKGKIIEDAFLKK
jgi:hypothetical protein